MAIIQIRELPIFTKRVGKIITKKERKEIAEYLAFNPESGEIIPGLYGLRKIRFKTAGTGKRGGIRVIYYFYNYNAPLYLFDVYKKNMKEDLTSEQKKRLSIIVQQIKKELAAKE